MQGWGKLIILAAFVSACESPKPSQDCAPKGESGDVIRVAGECVLTEKDLAVAVLIPTHWKFDEATAKSLGYSEKEGRVVWRFSCNLQTGVCDDATTFDVAGHDLNWIDITVPGGMRVASRTGKVVVVQWGPHRTLAINTADGKVSYTESGPTTEGRGEARCSPSFRVRR